LKDFTSKTRNRSLFSRPEVFPLQELIIQSLIRRFLSENCNLSSFLELVDVKDLDVETLEVLGEKALPSGHVDILIKEAAPMGRSKKLVLEIKAAKAQSKDVEQLEKYVEELGEECTAGILIAREFPKRIIQKIGMQDKNLKLVTYGLSNFSPDEVYTFEQLLGKIRFAAMPHLKFSP
jgi:hypothetical protein